MYGGASKQRGVTLIEVLVGVTVGLIILAGAVTVITNLSFSGLENSRATRLNQELRSTLDFIHRDLQRSGYANIWDDVNWLSWGDLTDAETDAIELALAVGGVVNIGGDTDFDGDGNNDSCITFSYDANDDGAFEDADGDGVVDETFGFRFNNGAVERGTDVSCGNGAGWQDITSGGISVTRLSFAYGADEDSTPEEDKNWDGTDDGIRIYIAVDEDSDSCTPSANPTTVGETCVCAAGDVCLGRRTIDVVLEGELATDAGVTVVLRDQVKLKNDHYYRFDDLP